MHDAQPASLDAIPGIGWYFNEYWKDAPICSGRLANTTKVQPVIDWPGLYYFAEAVPGGAVDHVDHPVHPVAAVASDPGSEDPPIRSSFEAELRHSSRPVTETSGS